jgi:hypothetical protein
LLLADGFTKPGVAVEKLRFRPEQAKLGDGKCPGALRKSLVGLPNAILFLPILGERVFQHPQALALIEGF